MLKYSLVENLLTERQDDYSAQTHSLGSLDKEAIITRMLNRGTLLTRTDIVAVLNNFEETMNEVHLEGYTVTLPLFNTSTSISGVFESPLDSFDPNRHKLNINLTKGAVLRNTEKNLKFEKTNTATPLPNIQEVKDSLSGTVNEKLTSKGVIELRGYNLKIEGDDPTCGLWIMDADTNEEMKCEVFIENKPSKVIAALPALPNGNYLVKVASQHTGGGTMLRVPKTFIYPKTLHVGT